MTSKNSVWISLSVGHDVSAEARWILPMLCGRGNITKRNIGAIKIQQTETHVELTADCVDGFFKAVGDSGKMEKNIVVTRLQGLLSAPKDSYDGNKHQSKKKIDNSNPRYAKPGEGANPKHPFKKKNKDRNPSDAKPNGGNKFKGNFKKK